MAQPPDPRTLATRKLAASEWLVVTNSDVAWSATTAATYMAARGVPAGNTVAVALGTNALSFDPGSNANIGANIVAPILAALTAKGCLGILLAPGCPNGVLVRGRASVSTGYQPAIAGTPPLATLVSGVRSYAARLAAAGGLLLAIGDTTFTNLQWGGGSLSGGTWQALWPLLLWRQLGTAADPTTIAPVVPLSDAFPASATYLATSLATQTLSTSSDMVPVGRIGVAAWETLAVPESSSNALDAATSATAGLLLGSQPAPIVLGLWSGYADSWAALYERATGWGYTVKYHWRTSPAGAAATACPAGGPNEAFTNAQLAGGSVVNFDYYALGGVADNADAPESAAPYNTAFLPADGALVVMGGFSAAYRYGARGVTRGGAGGGFDATHRTTSSLNGTWPVHYLLMAGLSLAEAGYYGGQLVSGLATGDPLYRPWHFDPGPDVGAGGSVGSSVRPIRRWGARRLGGGR